MTIIVDECLPKRLTRFFENETAWTVPQIGLAGAKDGELLDALDRKKIDVFITIDGNIEYQQQFTNRTFGTVIIRSVSNRFSDLIRLESELVKIAHTITPGQIVHIP
jgi:predicted nuclease of predicted toxin-antitoxin system